MFVRRKNWSALPFPASIALPFPVLYSEEFDLYPRSALQKVAKYQSKRRKIFVKTNPRVRVRLRYESTNSSENLQLKKKLGSEAEDRDRDEQLEALTNNFDEESSEVEAEDTGSKSRSALQKMETTYDSLKLFC